MAKGYVDMSDPEYEDGEVLWLKQSEADLLVRVLLLLRGSDLVSSLEDLNTVDDILEPLADRILALAEG